MFRFIVLLIISAVLAVITVQNLTTPIALVILSGKMPAVPFGLLLLGAFCLGALVTLVLYGLVSLHRPPESKYRPMGRRVPYPDGPDSGFSDPELVSSTTYSPATQAYSGSASTFVSEPAPSTYPQTPMQPPPQDSLRDPRSPRPAGMASPTPQSTVIEASSVQINSPSPEKKKSKPFFFLNNSLNNRKSNPKNESKNPPTIGDNWGELRTAAQRNSWDDDLEGASDRKQGLFDFIRTGVADNSTRREQPPAYRYDDDLDRGWENFDDYDDEPPSGEAHGSEYETRVYRDGLYSDDAYEDSPYEDGSYDGRAYDDEPYDDPGSLSYSDPAYSDPDEENLNRIGPDGVYEADYRVIVPPARPLLDSEDLEDER